jgi:hypothetical protein
MKLKLFVLTFLMITFALSVFGQERVNRKKISFDQSSNIMTKSTGWAYNKTLGEWVDYENLISDDKDYKTKYKSLLGEWMMSHNNQNFLSIQTKTVTFKGIKYFVLLIENWGGRYEYPTIEEDWYTFKETNG